VAHFWRVARIWWDRSRTLSWGLPLSGVCAVLFATLWPQSPGVSIGLLALAAGIMSVRPKMHFAEKLTWIIVLIAFAILEVRSIRRSDQEAREYRDSQNQAFKEIATDLKASMSNSAGQYQSTIIRLEGVLGETEKLNALAQRSLENITGGDSYIAMIPDVAYSGNDITFSVINRGKAILAGASVLITTQGVFWPGVRPLLMDAVSKRLELPTMHPDERMVIDSRVQLPPDRPEGDIQRIYVTVAAPNFSTEEYLEFRRTHQDLRSEYAWEYKYQIFRVLPYHSYKVGEKVGKYPLLEQTGWTTENDPKIPVPGPQRR
jgi:hypothetical protein